MLITNDTGATPRRVLSGRSVAHRHLDARQRACLAADWIDGRVVLQPTIRQASELLGVSPTYIVTASRLSDKKRAAISSGQDCTSFVALLKLPAKQPVLLKSVNGNDKVSDADLIELAKTNGPDRLLAAAVAAEAAASR
jgi:hypothetical protein